MNPYTLQSQMIMLAGFRPPVIDLYVRLFICADVRTWSKERPSSSRSSKIGETKPSSEDELRISSNEDPKLDAMVARSGQRATKSSNDFPVEG